jgi:hypothetical protein
LLLLPPALLALTGLVLGRWADSQVVGHSDYILLFLVGNVAWLVAVWCFMPMLGISIRLDAIDRDNPAAMAAVCGALAGGSIIYALANVGGGPTIWTTIAPALAATVGWVIIWIMMECVAGDLSDAITIGRDTASGLRCGGTLLGCGIILGRAAGGIWISWDQTWADMARFGWPAVVLGLAAALVHRARRPTVAHPTRDVLVDGWLWAIGFVLAASTAVAMSPHGLHPSKW